MRIIERPIFKIVALGFTSKNTVSSNTQNIQMILKKKICYKLGFERYFGFGSGIGYRSGTAQESGGDLKACLNQDKVV